MPRVGSWKRKRGDGVGTIVQRGTGFLKPKYSDPSYAVEGSQSTVSQVIGIGRWQNRPIMVSHVRGRN